MSEDAIHEDILFCLTIPEHETAQGMISVLHGYIDDKQIAKDQMVGFCTDGAPSMAGHRAGLCTLVMNGSPSAIWMHCMMHGEQLEAKELSTELGDILQQVTSTVNDIKPHPLRARLFTKLCGDMESEQCSISHPGLVLSRGRAGNTFFCIERGTVVIHNGCKKNRLA
jgi:hypothetical protein